MFFCLWGGTFGMPAENAARDNKLDHEDWTNSNIESMKGQLKRLGLSIDWEREFQLVQKINYKHQQMFFLKLLEKN